MPTIEATIDITPRRFVNGCSQMELYELWHIMNESAIQKKIAEMENGPREEPFNSQSLKALNSSLKKHFL